MLKTFFQRQSHKRSHWLTWAWLVEYKMKPIIGQTMSGGPASLARIEANDVVLSIGSSRIDYASDIRESISSMPNRDVSIKVLRDNNVIDLPVSIGSLIQ